MAKAIHYEVPKPPKQDEARRELDKLLENLHEAGVLRFANDFLQASPQVLEILLKGMNQEETRNAVQNVSLLAMALGRIPPERFATLTRGFTEGVDKMEEAAGTQKDEQAPGLFGTLRLLKDQDLWAGLRPIIAGVKGFSEHLHEAPDKPAAKRHDGVNSAS